MLCACVGEVLLSVLKDGLYVHALRRVYSGLFLRGFQRQRLALNFVAGVATLLMDGLVLPLIVVLVGVRPQTLWLHYLMVHDHLLGALAVLEGTQASGTVLFGRKTWTYSRAVS